MEKRSEVISSSTVAALFVAPRKFELFYHLENKKFCVDQFFGHLCK